MENSSYSSQYNQTGQGSQTDGESRIFETAAREIDAKSQAFETANTSNYAYLIRPDRKEV